jgi:hypothetical protein
MRIPSGRLTASGRKRLFMSTYFFLKCNNSDLFSRVYFAFFPDEILYRSARPIYAYMLLHKREVLLLIFRKSEILAAANRPMFLKQIPFARDAYIGASTCMQEKSMYTSSTSRTKPECIKRRPLTPLSSISRKSGALFRHLEMGNINSRSLPGKRYHSSCPAIDAGYGI